MSARMNSKPNLLGIACAFFIFACSTEAVILTKVFDVKDFGAIADGKTDNSKALLDAWTEACAWDGVGRVLIPEGTFLVGPVVLKGPCKGNTTIKVIGTVQAPELEKFASDGWIDFQYIDGLTVTGGGTFHAQGASAWAQNECSKNTKCKQLPKSLRFSFVTNSTVRKITSVDSKNVHYQIFACKNLKLQSIKISAPEDSPNTDGIHLGDSSEIEISHSVIQTGDDCISIGPGNFNITISDVSCGPGHGISIGSLGRSSNDKDLGGVFVRNCSLTGTQNGIRIKTWPDSYSISASNFHFKDILMNNVFNPIVIDQEYCPYNFCSKEAPSRVKISDVSFTNIHGSSASQVAVNLLCSKSVPCQDVKLSNINIVYNGSDGPAKSSCSNVQGSSSGVQNPPSCI